MKYSIEVLDISHIDTNDYMASTYPSSGIFRKVTGTNSGWYFFVDKLTNVVYGMPRNLIEPVLLPAAGGSNPPDISDILKIIAVSQKPDLMKDKL